MTKKTLFVRTAKEFIAPLPRFTFEGRIIVVQSPAEIKKAVAFLRRCPILGIDTETRPSFRKGTLHKVALLQIATPTTCFLFRLCFTGLTPELTALLSDQSVLKVGLSLKDDLQMLHHRAPFVPGGFFDLQDLVPQMGIKDLSLQKLYANVFHERISKSARLSNWEIDVLSESQKRYAATDAVACIRLYEALKALQETGDYELIQPA